jgi:Na+-driven multidrug efflux pump
MIYAVSIMLIGTALIQLLANQIVSLFDASPELLSMGSMVLRIICVSYIFAAYTLIAQGVYQALGNGTYSLIITLMRVAVVLLPTLYIFVRIFALNQVWWAFVLAEVFSAGIGAFLLYRIYTRKVAPIKQQNTGVSHV